MTATIALFRSINVGGNNKLPMNDLSTALETLGYTKIHTYIHSGNVVFHSKQPPSSMDRDAISNEIERLKGFRPVVLLLTVNQLQEAIKHNPFSTDNGQALHFYFLESTPPSPNIPSLNSLKTTTEQFKLVGSVFYLLAPDGVGRSKLAAAVEHEMGVPATARNWNTVNKLAKIAVG